MAQRLYYDDAYTTRFEAVVARAEPAEEGRTHVELKATYFYPTSGGQMHDRGTLAGLEVVDVFEDEGRIVHVVASPDFVAVGTKVEGLIDAERRRHHRQQHTGQHILSRVLENRLGLPTLSSRLGENGNTLDVEDQKLGISDLEPIEDEVNAYLWADHPVTVRYLSAEEASSADLRKVPGGQERVRVVEVGDLDRCACGGTHVRTAAEIGLVVITRVEKFKGGSRIHFLCGDRGRLYLRQRDRLVGQWMDLMTTGPEALESATRRLLSDVKSLRKQSVALVSEVMEHEAMTWLDSAEELPWGEQRLRWVARVLPADRAAGVSRALARLTSADGVVAAVIVAPPQPSEGAATQIVLGRSADVPLHCGDWLNAALAPLGGKGGGRPEHARGGAGGVSPEAALKAVRSALPSPAQ